MREDYAEEVNSMRNQIVADDLKEIVQEDIPWEAFRNATVMVTGANGILPSYMVDTLLYLNESKGYNIHIIGLVRNKEKANRRFEANDKLDFIVQDVCQPISYEGNIDYIIHAAGQASPKFYGKDPVGTIEGHILGTDNCLRLAVEKHVRGFLYFSSCDVYGTEPEENIIDEHYAGRVDTLSERSCYPVGKLAAESLCAAYKMQYNVPVRIMRIAHTYGPLMPLNDGRVFADFVSNILRNEDIALNSDGSAERPMLYISDAVRAYFRILLQGETGEAYNVVSDEQISILDLAKTLVDLCPNKRLKVVFLKKEIGNGYLQAKFKNNRYSSEKLKELGWKQHYSVREGFRRTIKSYSTEAIYMK